MSDNNSTLIEKLESIAYSAGDERQTRIIELDDVLDIIRQHDAQINTPFNVDNKSTGAIATISQDSDGFVVTIADAFKILENYQTSLNTSEESVTARPDESCGSSPHSSTKTSDHIPDDKKMVERVAKALFELEQSAPFPPKLTNLAIYGQHPVTWELINGEQYVSICSDAYRKQAKAAIAAIKG